MHSFSRSSAFICLSSVSPPTLIPEIALFKQILQTVRHNRVPHIVWMKHIIKRTDFCQNPSLSFWHLKLRAYGIPYTDHRKIIAVSHRVSGVPEDSSHLQKQKTEALQQASRKIQHFTYKAFIAVPLCFIPSSLTANSITTRSGCFLSAQNISVKADHPQLRRGCLPLLLYQSDIILCCKALHK